VGVLILGVKAAMTLAWCFFGKEVIRVSDGQLVWLRQACGFGPDASFPVQGITNIRVNKAPSNFSIRYPSPWKPYWGRVSFDCAGYVHNIGLKVNDIQAADLVASLSPYLSSSIAQPQPAASPAPAVQVVPAPRTQALPPELPLPTSAPPASERKAFCTRCGAENSSHDRFCGQCGLDAGVAAPQHPAPGNAPPMPPCNPPAGNPLPGPALEMPGSMARRLGAYFADAALVWVATLAAIFFLTLSGYFDADVSDVIAQGRFGLTQLAVWLAYMVFAQSAYRTTIGKYVFGLELASSREPNAKPEFGSILLRETIGKFCSCIVLCAGLIRAFWDPRKQTWHDQMADTIVRQRPTNPSLRKQLTALVATAAVLCAGAGIHDGWKEFVKAETESAAQDFKSAVEECTAANARVHSIGSLPTESWAQWQERDRTMLDRANEYETKLTAVSDVLHRILLKQLYTDHNEFLYYVYQQKVYNQREESNKKLKDGIQLILSTSPEQADYQEKLSTVNMINNEINESNKQIEQFDQAWRETSSQEEESPL
jgi:uncharacterized RDD family membrane protein YckC